MKYNVKIHQVVLDNENAIMKKGRIFTKCMLGNVPSLEEFNNFYETVISFNLNSDENNIMDVCEECFAILNSPDINTYKNLTDFNILNTWRSLSVGDILEINNKLYIVKMMGFAKFPERSITFGYLEPKHIPCIEGI